MSVGSFLKRRKDILAVITITLISSLVVVAHYINKPSPSEEILVMKTQYSQLKLPENGEYSENDRGCVYDSWEKSTECTRSIYITYRDADLRQSKKINDTLLQNGWWYAGDSSQEPYNGDPMPIEDLMAGKQPEQNSEATYHYRKDIDKRKLCAVLTVEGRGSNPNPYRPWMYLHMLAETEKCS